MHAAQNKILHLKHSLYLFPICLLSLSFSLYPPLIYQSSIDLSIHLKMFLFLFFGYLTVSFADGYVKTVSKGWMLFTCARLG